MSPHPTRLRAPRAATLALILCAGLAGAGCEDPVAVEVPWLELPERIDLEDLDPSEDAVFTVRMRNRGTAPAEVRLDADAPLSVLSERLSVAPDRTGHAGIQLKSDGSGAPVETWLRIETGVQSVEIPVYAEFAEEPVD